MVVLAELGRYSVRFQFRQQILGYHDRTVQLPNSRLVKLGYVR